MAAKVHKFAQRVSEVFPEIPVDAVLAIWEEIDDPSVEGPIPEYPKVEVPTCKHMFIKGRNANTRCKTKVKGGAEYCSKHKK